MNFTNRTTYLAAITEWKLAYQAQSTNIRVLRAEYHEKQRLHSKATGLPTYLKAYTAMTDSLRELLKARIKANELLSERAAGKEEAQRQYLAEKTA
jgi:hypothetical protein